MFGKDKGPIGVLTVMAGPKELIVPGTLSGYVTRPVPFSDPKLISTNVSAIDSHNYQKTEICHMTGQTKVTVHPKHHISISGGGGGGDSGYVTMAAVGSLALENMGYQQRSVFPYQREPGSGYL